MRTRNQAMDVCRSWIYRQKLDSLRAWSEAHFMALVPAASGSIGMASSGVLEIVSAKSGAWSLGHADRPACAGGAEISIARMKRPKRNDSSTREAELHRAMIPSFRRHGTGWPPRADEEMRAVAATVVRGSSSRTRGDPPVPL